MKPFLDGKKSTGSTSLSAAPAALPHAGAAALRARAGASGAASPTIEMVKEGDKVIRLVITCSCGERMEVECLYPPGV